MNAVGDLNDLNARINPHLEVLAVPSEHTKFTSTESGRVIPINATTALKSKEGFENQWAKQLDILKYVATGETDKELLRRASPNFINMLHGYRNQPPNVFFGDILELMIERDIKFQGAPREHRRAGSDPHESFLRSYIFGGKSIKSTEFATLFTGLGTFIDRLHTAPTSLGLTRDNAIYLQGRVGTLGKTWEAKHPRQQFIPAGK